MEKVPVLITTKHRGVFFGFASSEDLMQEHIVLERCRNCIVWTAEVKGFLGLAATGPLNGCRIGAEVPKFLVRDVTGVAMCTDQAAAAWTTFK